MKMNDSRITLRLLLRKKEISADGSQTHHSERTFRKITASVNQEEIQAVCRRSCG